MRLARTLPALLLLALAGHASAIVSLRPDAVATGTYELGHCPGPRTLALLVRETAPQNWTFTFTDAGATELSHPACRGPGRGNAFGTGTPATGFKGPTVWSQPWTPGPASTFEATLAIRFIYLEEVHLKGVSVGPCSPGIVCASATLVQVFSTKNVTVEVTGSFA